MRLFRKQPKKKVFILGNQKSGTSAISHLMADAGGISKTIDIPALWPPNIQKLISGELHLKQIVAKNKREFRSALIKEPNLTFLADQLIDLFPEADIALVVRDPFQNIRSILNRYKLPGDLDELSHEHIEELGWHYNLFDATHWKYENAENYVHVLARRWSHAVDAYLNASDSMILLKYEDFLLNKVDFIARACTSLGLEPKHDISSLTEIQFQPKGNPNTPVEDFFGKKNHALVMEECSSRMKTIGY